VSNPHIVILDDEAPITALCERQLSKHEYTATGFVSPQDAVAYLGEHKAELLLVDIRMPEMDGFTVMSEVQKIQPDIAILVMTGYGTVETAIRALRQGVDGLLLKPFQRDDLLQAVAQALADNRKKHDAARIQALRPLFAVSESLFAETRPDQLMQLVLEAVCSHLRCANAGFYAYSFDERELRLVEGRGRVLPNEPSDLGATGVGRADAINAPVVANVGSPADSGLRKLLKRAALGAMMCVPVTLQNFRGVFFAGRDPGLPPFSEADLDLFLILGRQAAIAMENARLYGELRDYITRVEESQRALIQAEKLATAGRMTAAIAHEINNPLQAVQNCLHLAARGDLPDEMRQKYFDMTKAELERLMNTVQRMLEFYRPTVARQPVQIVDLLDHVVHLMSSELLKRGIRVTTSWPSTLPDVMAVSSQLQQVFINLVLNAVDAMPEGGELLVSVGQRGHAVAARDYDASASQMAVASNSGRHPAEVSGRPARSAARTRAAATLVGSPEDAQPPNDGATDFIEISFADTGPGVAADVRDSLFEPFVSTKPGGTGLGLSVSYGIVSAHGGELWLDTARRGGACFRILLPVERQI
jgi:signal transduction histidine kinase/FixJ family two-component response regulator